MGKFSNFVGNKAIGRISKRMLQGNKARQIFSKNVLGGKKYSFFRKTWRALFSCNTCFEIRPFALLPTIYAVYCRLIFYHS